ncbi:zwei Ig domain protein zig-3 [Parasteatoda tepidariorum]|nr:zwei Ig domain protein zig-3 [Parasteatoda tepidariorum]
MMQWNTILFLILATVPSAFSRHLDYGKTKDQSRKRGENRDDDHNWFLSKSHLRLHQRPPPVVRVKEGDSEFLECQAGGNPPPRIYWLKGGEMMSKINLQDELDIKAFEDSEVSGNKLQISSTTSRLYLDCLSMDDEGDYTCVAETAKLRESTSTRISVSSSDERKCHDKSIFGRAPRIHQWTKTMLENQGESTKIMCRADGVPMPSIKWYDPKEREIDADESGRYEVLPSGDLIIRNLKWSDMGNYVCVAENAHGVAQVEAFVYPANPES